MAVWVAQMTDWVSDTVYWTTGYWLRMTWAVCLGSDQKAIWSAINRHLQDDDDDDDDEWVHDYVSGWEAKLDLISEHTHS